MTFLDPDPRHVEEPEPSYKPRRVGGCLLLLVAILVLATPRSIVHAISTAQALSGESASGNLERSSGVPPVPVPSLPAIPTTGVNLVPKVSMPAPTSGIGTALFQTTATWCAPTATLCHGWGGRVQLAALPGYDGHPYDVLVTYGSRSVIVKVVSTCGCGIDLSPYAFQQLAPLSKGRIIVTVEGPI